MPLARIARLLACPALAAFFFHAPARHAPVPRQPAQSETPEKVVEVAANLATGQVAIIAARDGFVVATLARPFEPGSLPPLIVPLDDNDVAVALGAVDWVEPPSNHPILQLARELPSLIRHSSGGGPRLAGLAGSSDLPEVGLAVLDRLRAAAQNLHARIQLPEDFPLAQLLFVRQPADRSGSFWSITYWLQQRFLEENFWDSQVGRPDQIRLFPAGKEEPAWFEFRYPPGDAAPGPLEWLSHPTGPLAKAVESDPRLARTQSLLAAGKQRQIKLADLVPLVKTALETMLPASTPKAMLSLDLERGFAWVIEPPPASLELPNRPPGAPTLETHP